MKRVSRRVIALVMMTMLLLGMAGIATIQASEETPENPHAAVVREVLVAGYPNAAPGQVLELVRYTIPGNIALPIHIHPGMQAAFVESGTLHYTVVEGSAAFTRADGETGVLMSGEETDLKPGDSLVEAQGMIHFGENRGDEPIVLLVSSLFEADVPPSSLVGIATPAP